VVGGYAHPAGYDHHREAVPEVVKVYPSAYDHRVWTYCREDPSGEEGDGERQEREEGEPEVGVVLRRGQSMLES